MFRAHRELRECPAETAPLPDVADPLGGLGISTVLVDMDEGISGLTLISADGSVLVAANRTHPILRRAKLRQRAVQGAGQPNQSRHFR